jgi:hypothetical protein
MVIGPIPLPGNPRVSVVAHTRAFPAQHPSVATSGGGWFPSVLGAGVGIALGMALVKLIWGDDDEPR